MKISKTKISKRAKRKTNPELVKTIELAKKKCLLELGKKLSGPTRLQKKINLDELNKLKESKVIVVGKVLGDGEINKKISVAALGFSQSAKDKLKKAGCEAKTIRQELEGKGNLKEIKII